MSSTYYDQSYPPSLWTPVPIPATGVTPGIPGSFTPPGCDIPANITALRTMGPLGETIAWTVGQYVVLGDNTHAYWGGTIWAVGEAP